VRPPNITLVRLWLNGESYKLFLLAWLNLRLSPHEAERDALIRIGRQLDGTVVIMTGVPRLARAG
jgi:hypothetical protein